MDLIRQKTLRSLPHLLALLVWPFAIFFPMFAVAASFSALFFVSALFRKSENYQKREWMESAFALALASGLMFAISSLNDTVLKGFFSVGVFLLHAVSALVAVVFLWLEKNYRYPLSPIAPFFTDEKIRERSWRREMGDGSVKILQQLFVAIDSLKKIKVAKGIRKRLHCLQASQFSVKKTRAFFRETMQP